MIEDLDCARNIIDDFLVWGVLKEELDQGLKRLLDKACEYNLKLVLYQIRVALQPQLHDLKPLLGKLFGKLFY